MLFHSSPYLFRYTKLGKDELMGMTVIQELQEFLQDAQENATLLNRYIRDVSSCLINEKVAVYIKDIHIGIIE